MSAVRVELEPAQIVRYRYQVAGYWFLAAFVLHLCSVGLVVAGVLLACYPVVLSWLSSLAGVAAVLSYVGFWWHDRNKNEAELLQQRLLLADSLGGAWAFSERERHSMHASLGANARKEAAQLKTADEYYDSQSVTGPQRLLDNAQESVFFTQHIAHHARNQYLLWVCLLVVVAVSSIYVSACTLAGGALNALVRIAVLFLFAALTGGVLKRGVGFSALAQTCADIDSAMDELRKAGTVELERVLPLVHAYQCALILAPLLPSSIYNREHDMLTEQWLARASR
ncbi:MAG TPA: hypothetical protein VM537_22920 [Anaerolineae bacterium]|nr:hypothetical protein [Anaerolineae bacterium]